MCSCCAAKWHNRISEDGLSPWHGRALTVLSTRKPTPVLWAIVELLTITWLALPAGGACRVARHQGVQHAHACMITEAVPTFAVK